MQTETNKLHEYETPPVEAKAVVKKRQFEMRETGQLALVSLEDQLSFAQKLISEGLVSKSFETAGQVVIGFQYAKALGINELLAMKMLYVLNGRPCLYAEGPLSLVQRLPSFGKIREYFVDKDSMEISPANKNLTSEVYAAVTELWRKGSETPQVDFFTLDDLKRAGIDQGKNGKKDVWVKWLRIMLRYKARTLALRSQFADALAGIAIAEYDHNFTPEVPEISPTINKAAEELNETYLNETT